MKEREIILKYIEAEITIRDREEAIKIERDICEKFRFNFCLERGLYKIFLLIKGS